MIITVLSGLVFDIQVKIINNRNYIIRAKIRHGQSVFTKTTNNAWICVKTDGEILHDNALAWLVWEKYATMLEESCFIYF